MVNKIYEKLTTHTAASRNDSRFPFKAVILAALLPAILGLCCGLFIVRPTIDYDTAVGLAAWANYAKGGTWNTVSRANPENIASTIEENVTWWPPGQYLPLGLLQSAGLSLGVSALVIAFLSILSLGIGGAALTRALGGEYRVLPWVSASFACSHYALINFNHFWGGETGLMATFPWITLLAWKLRNRSSLLTLTLPLLFLFGSFIKHSFAIHSICIISFLWLEKNRENFFSSSKKLKPAFQSFRSAIPLIATGLVYILLRKGFINTTVSPTSEFGITQPRYSLATYLGYSAWGPLLAPFSLGSLSDRLSEKLLNLNETRIWEHLSIPLTVFSPVAIGSYTWLSFRRSPLARLAGISSLLNFGLHFYLYTSGGFIELRDRYYQFPGFLLLATVAMQISSMGWKQRTAKIILGAGILIGAASVVQRSFAIKSWAPLGHPMGIVNGIPESVLNEIRSLATQSGDCVLALPTPILEVELYPVKHPSTRLLAIYDEEELQHGLFHGRVPLIVIIYPKNWEHTGECYSKRFIDYSRNEWESHEIENWIFLKSKTDLPEQGVMND